MKPFGWLELLANAIPPQKSQVWIDDRAVDTHGFTALVKFGCAKCAMMMNDDVPNCERCSFTFSIMLCIATIALMPT